jgi:hypothetical protein
MVIAYYVHAAELLHFNYFYPNKKANAKGHISITMREDNDLSKEIVCVLYKLVISQKE